MVMLLGAASAALFTSVSLLTKHDHWSLRPQEGQALAEALNNALDTLPVKSYELITKIIEQWVPWIQLLFVVAAITVPRLEESAKRVESKNYQPSDGSPKGDGRSGPVDTFDDVSSAGGDFGRSPFGVDQNGL